MFKFYAVGGCVRDELMGVQSKDIDYVVVAEEELLLQTTNPEELFYVLKNHLEKLNFHIWLVTESCFTIRAKFPEGTLKAGVTADFVLARKEIGYIKGTRQPMVIAGTLYDDLERRDFTVNAIAKSEDGNYIDLFNGVHDITRKILRTPLDVKKTLDDDPLRILRAVRFQITKGFSMCDELRQAIIDYDYESKMKVVSTERIRDELFKCFKHDTLKTIKTLHIFLELRNYIFENTNLWLEPTMKSK